MSPTEAVGHWIAQFVGAIAGAALLRGMFAAADGYSTGKQGLGTGGYGSKSSIHLGMGGAFLAEVVLTGTSVNPARSLGPALFVGGTALNQVWLFIVAPLLGGVVAALAARYFYPGETPAPETTARADVLTARETTGTRADCRIGSADTRSAHRALP